MKTQKLLIVLASAGLAIGMAGCSSSDKKAEDAPKPPSISQVEKQKQKAEKEAKAKAEAEAKAKAEQEAKAKAEAEAKAKAEAEAAAKAEAPAPAKAQPKARNYQPKQRTYQRKAQPKRHYQAPRRSGTKAKSGNSGGWKVGESRDYQGNRWTRTSENEVQVSGCGDSEGNTWAC